MMPCSRKTILASWACANARSCLAAASSSMARPARGRRWLYVCHNLKNAHTKHALPCFGALPKSEVEGTQSHKDTKKCIVFLGVFVTWCSFYRLRMRQYAQVAGPFARALSPRRRMEEEHPQHNRRMEEA